MKYRGRLSCSISCVLMVAVMTGGYPSVAQGIMRHDWTNGTERSLGIRIADTDSSEEILGILDSQLFMACMLSHFIWQTSRFVAFTEKSAESAPFDSYRSAATGAAVRLRADVDTYLDVYSTLLLKIGTGPARLNINARLERISDQFNEQGLPQFSRFLPILMDHVRRLQSGNVPSREEMRTSILSVSSAR
jgi:hypothetical protein